MFLQPARETLRRRDGVMNSLPAPLGPILHLSRELTAGGVDIFAARPAHRRNKTFVVQHALEGENSAARTGPEFRVGKWIERDQVELARHVAHERGELARLLRRIVDG